MEITLVPGDITRQQVDAVVNAANSSLLGGGGVDGAIHGAGGPEILAECRELRASQYPDGLPTGRAVATTAGRLPARWVIHTVGPVYPTGRAYGSDAELADRSRLLAACYRESLRLASELGARSVAFPAISAGTFGWPLDDAARIALSTVEAERAAVGSAVDEARFVLFGEDASRAFEAALRELRMGR
jgi:O-acetyl-ADP-ribose deacetylase (regulator of RNase III)